MNAEPKIRPAGRELFMGQLPPHLAHADDEVELLLLKEYGSVFVARNGVRPPTRIVFRNESEVAEFQRSLDTSTAEVGGFRMELQARAMVDLLKARDEAEKAGLSITARFADSGRRGYEDTVGLWKSRVDPALVHWVGNGKLDRSDAERIAALSPFEQVPEVLKLEADGIYFAKDLSKSIIYSVAPPGASQHLSMLAIDLNEFHDERVRSVLARHGWFRTVVSDLPHFTYLGADESDLPSLGLKRLMSAGEAFWVPDL